MSLSRTSCCLTFSKWIHFSLRTTAGFPATPEAEDLETGGLEEPLTLQWYVHLFNLQVYFVLPWKHFEIISRNFVVPVKQMKSNGEKCSACFYSASIYQSIYSKVLFYWFTQSIQTFVHYFYNCASTVLIHFLCFLLLFFRRCPLFSR